MYFVRKGSNPLADIILFAFAHLFDKSGKSWGAWGRFGTGVG